MESDFLKSDVVIFSLRAIDLLSLAHCPWRRERKGQKQDKVVIDL